MRKLVIVITSLLIAFGLISIVACGAAPRVTPRTTVTPIRAPVAPAATPTNVPPPAATFTPAPTATAVPAASATPTPSRTPTSTPTSAPATAVPTATRPASSPSGVIPGWPTSRLEFLNAVFKPCPPAEKVASPGHVKCEDLKIDEVKALTLPSGAIYFEVTRQGSATTTDHEIPWFHIRNPWPNMQFGWIHGDLRKKCGLQTDELVTLGYTERNLYAGIPGEFDDVAVEGLSFYPDLGENLGKLSRQTAVQRCR